MKLHNHYFSETTFGLSKDAYYTMDRFGSIAVYCEGFASKGGKVGSQSPDFVARDILKSMKRAGQQAGKAPLESGPPNLISVEKS